MRDDALHLLELLSERFWQSAAAPKSPARMLGGFSEVWAAAVEPAATAGNRPPEVSEEGWVQCNACLSWWPEQR